MHENITDLTNFLNALILVSGTARIIYCIIAMMYTEDNIELKKRTKNTIVFIVVAEVIINIPKIIFSYF